MMSFSPIINVFNYFPKVDCLGKLMYPNIPGFDDGKYII